MNNSHRAFNSKRSEDTSNNKSALPLAVLQTRNLAEKELQKAIGVVSDLPSESVNQLEVRSQFLILLTIQVVFTKTQFCAVIRGA